MKRFWILMLSVALSFSFTSCKNKDANVPSEHGTFSVALPYTIYVGKTSVWGNAYLEIGKDYLKLSTEWPEGHKMQFASVGQIKGLEQINSVPSEGWHDSYIETNEGYGYVMRYHNGNFWSYHRIYIKEYVVLGGDDWYCKIQYDSDWNPLSNN